MTLQKMALCFLRLIHKENQQKEAQESVAALSQSASVLCHKCSWFLKSRGGGWRAEFYSSSCLKSDMCPKFRHLVPILFQVVQEVIHLLFGKYTNCNDIFTCSGLEGNLPTLSLGESLSLSPSPSSSLLLPQQLTSKHQVLSLFFLPARLLIGK